jgi:hypothetical protein
MIGDLVWKDWIDANLHWAHFVLPLVGAIGIVMVGRIVAPSPAHGPKEEAVLVAEEAAGAATFAAIPLLLRVIAVLASAYGYSLGESGGVDTTAAILAELRPLLAAVIAVVVGEAVTWAMTRGPKPATR